MNSVNLSTSGLLAVILLSAPLAHSQTTPSSTGAPATPAVPPPKPCIANENRQFDFWIGDWDVTTPDGKPAGTNLIKLILGGCVLHESWNGRGGLVGQSFNVYDAKRKVWHQTWVDGRGDLLVLEGRFENGLMTLSDKDMPGKADANVIKEIAWSSLASGVVRQLWRTSSDGGKSWGVAFDGQYLRSAREQPPGAASSR